MFCCAYIDGLVQDFSNTCTLAMELLQTCTTSSILSILFGSTWCNYPCSSGLFYWDPSARWATLTHMNTLTTTTHHNLAQTVPIIARRFCTFCSEGTGISSAAIIVIWWLPHLIGYGYRQVYLLDISHRPGLATSFSLNTGHLLGYAYLKILPIARE